MTSQELYEYIKSRNYLCEFCNGLQKETMKHGLIAIKDYKGMICGGVEDMMIRLSEVEDSPKDEPAKKDDK